MPHILIVDDYSMLLEILQMALAGEPGYTVAIARSGSEALDIIEQRRPDLIITDYSMREMDGLELIRNIRVLPNATQIKIILYSAILNDTLVAQALELGATACLEKPFDLMELKRLIRKALEFE